MAVEKKQVFKQNLKSYKTFIQDTNSNSTYFKITELAETLTGGKNAFLIEGSELLEVGTEIKIEILDSIGNPVYTEAGDGYATSSIDSNGTPIITEYYEGTSKVIAVHVYTDTAYGPAQITILGEAKYYLDENNIRQEIPQEWKGIYNVKWQRNLNINPALPNTTKVRFYKKPLPTITEILSPIYRIESGSKVASNVTASFANINISQLETFAGDVKRVKVFRTSEGDISDYDLIQDIYVEAKELLTTYNTSGSVKGEAGLFSADTLSKAWNTGSLNAYLTSSRIDNGCKLSGSGYLTFTGSINITAANVYELTLDAFYSASTNSDLGIYISGSSNGEILIKKLNGVTPIRNLQNQLISFTIDKTEETASLYFSQSQGEWHLGNISLKLTEDTAFSPAEIDFVTSMPTVIGNETFNFKFEFYDVNNNFVPVAVTQSALFTGGNNNIGGTLTIVSASTTALSQSVSYDLWFNPTGSVTASIQYVSQSASSSLSVTSASLQSSSLYISASLSSSISTSLSSSYYYTDLLSASLSESMFSSSNFQYSYSAYLDGNIFTDKYGLINRPPTASVAGLYTGKTYLGFYSASVWKTYMDDQGDFYLTSSIPGGGFLAWDSAGASLKVAGDITILGGDAATTGSVEEISASAWGAYTSASSYSGSLAEAISASEASALEYSASISASTFYTTNLLDNRIFTDSTGKVVKPPVNTASNYGLYLGSHHMGFYSESVWRTYMDNAGKFYLTGSITDGYSNYLVWDGAGGLTVAGTINIIGTGGNAATKTDTANAVLSGSDSATNVSNSLAPNIFTNSNGRIVRAPSTGVAGLFLGSSYMGYHDGSGNALGWKTYMASNGDFYLTGSNSYLKWFPATGTLQIKGSIDITGGDSLTQIQNAASSGSNALTYAVTNNATASATAASQAATNANNLAAWALQNANTASINSLDARIFNDVNGKLNKTPTTGSTSGLYLGSTYMGYYSGANWKTYMANNGNFYLSGTDGFLTWNSAADTLAIKGDVTATNITATTAGNIAGWGISSTNFGTTRLKLNSTRPAMEVYDTAGNIVVDISTASSLSDKSAGSISPSPTSIATSTRLTNQGYNNAYSIFVEYSDDTISLGANSSTFTIGAGSALIGKSCAISAVLGGTNVLRFECSGDDGIPTNYVDNQEMGATLGFQITTPGGEVYYASTNAYVLYQTSHLTAYTMTYSPNVTVAASVVLEAGTYTITPFISNLMARAYMSNALEFDPYGNPSNGPATFDFDVLRPSLSSISAAVPVSKTEMIAGGFQVVYDTSRYISIPRANNADFVMIGGGLTCTGDVTANTSDERLKENIRIIENPLEKIENIRGVYFNYTEEAKLKTGYTNGEEQIGFIAQEVQKVLPHIVKPAPFDKDQSTGKSISGEDYLTIQYEKVVPLLLEGIKELKKEIEELKKNK